MPAQRATDATDVQPFGPPPPPRARAVPAQRATDVQPSGPPPPPRAKAAEVPQAQVETFGLPVEPFVATAREAPRSAATRRMHRWVRSRQARRDPPSWGPEAESLAAELCNEGVQEACTVLSREAEAKRLWLDKQVEELTQNDT